MPNWCSVSYRITGKDIQKLYNIIDNVQKNPALRLSSDFNIWWGDIIYQMGGNPGYHSIDSHPKDYHNAKYYKDLDRIAKEKPEILKLPGVYCRGEIILYEINNNILRIEYESAWDELPEVRAFLEAELNIDPIIFYAEETGYGIYKTNDIYHEYFKFDYQIEYDDNIEYFNNQQQVLNFANDYFKNSGKSFKTFKELITFLDDKENEDVQFFVNEITRI